MLRIMKLSWLVFLLFLLPVQAEIYRWVDDSGNVVYSDEPHADAETIELPASTVYTPVEEESELEPDILKLSPDEEVSAELTSPDVPNYQLRIISPANEESIWVNNGNVLVSMVVEPALNAERDDQIVIQLNGAQVGPAQATTSFQFDNLSRGTHTVSAMVVDKTGAALTNSASVTFHLHRTSILNKNTSNSAP